MKKTLYNFAECSLFLFLMALSVILSVTKRFQSAIIDGVSLWYACILPTVFPFAVITAITSALSVTSKISNVLSPFTTRIFKVNGAVGYAFFLNVLSGYPMGAKLIGELKEKGAISQTESVRASVLCSSSSPTFLIASVGGIMFNSVKFGLCLFCCHLVALIVTGFIFSFYNRKDKPTLNNNAPLKKIDNLFYESVFSSTLATLTVGGIIVVFYLLTEVLLYFGLLTPVVSFFSVFLGKQNGRAFALGIFECTKGLKALALGGFSALSLPIACFLTSFGGISVIMQSVAFLKRAKIKIAPFLLSKVCSAILSFVLGFVCYFICY